MTRSIEKAHTSPRYCVVHWGTTVEAKMLLPTVADPAVAAHVIEEIDEGAKTAVESLMEPEGEPS